LYFTCRNGTADDEPANQVLNLLCRGADADQKTITGLTPFHIAASKGFKKICEYFVDYGYGTADANFRGSRDCLGRTPLHWAATFGQLITVAFLNEHMKGRWPDKDNLGKTIMILAAGQGHHRVVRYLLLNSFPVDEQDNLGRTAFWHAAHVGHPEVLRILEQFPRTKHKDTDGRTPLATDPVRFLLSQKPWTNLKNKLK
jgi:ankyrin repeat protein